MKRPLKKYSVVIQGEILNRKTFQKDPFFYTCRSKTELNTQIGQVYNSVLENPELSITIMMRRGTS